MKYAKLRSVPENQVEQNCGNLPNKPKEINKTRNKSLELQKRLIFESCDIFDVSLQFEKT